MVFAGATRPVPSRDSISTAKKPVMQVAEAGLIPRDLKGDGPDPRSERDLARVRAGAGQEDPGAGVRRERRTRHRHHVRLGLEVRIHSAIGAAVIETSWCPGVRARSPAPTQHGPAPRPLTRIGIRRRREARPVEGLELDHEEVDDAEVRFDAIRFAEMSMATVQVPAASMISRTSVPVPVRTKLEAVGLDVGAASVKTLKVMTHSAVGAALTETSWCPGARARSPAPTRRAARPVHSPAIVFTGTAEPFPSRTRPGPRSFHRRRFRGGRSRSSRPRRRRSRFPRRA